VFRPLHALPAPPVANPIATAKTTRKNYVFDFPARFRVILPFQKHHRASALVRCISLLFFRGVAQPGSAFGSGPKGQGFESPLPDHLEKFACFAWGFVAGLYRMRLLQNPLGHKPSGLHLGDFLLDF
jgi:hypothetical protein